MTKPILQVIDGGPHPRAAKIDTATAAIRFEAILDRPAAEQFAARAERDAAMATGQVTAAVAILAKSKDQLVSLIAAAGQHEAAEAHDAFTRALAGADTLAAIFRAAEARFLIAAAAAARTADCYRSLCFALLIRALENEHAGPSADGRGEQPSLCAPHWRAPPI